MAKRPSKESRQKALKREAYRLNISVSELKRLKAASDGEECNSPVPHHGDTFVSHESYEEVSQQDDPGGHEAAAWQEATLGALGEAAAGEGAAQAPPVIRVVPGGHDAALPLAPLARAPPVISFVPGAQEVASQEATLQEVAAREGAAEAVITVVPGGHDAASGEARARKAARARETEGPVRAPPVITVVPGVREATLPEAASRAAFQEAAAQAAAAVGDQFINVLLNVDHDTHKFMIIKLVSNIDLRRSIEEVLSTVPIISQATPRFNCMVYLPLLLESDQTECSGQPP